MGRQSLCKQATVYETIFWVFVSVVMLSITARTSGSVCQLFCVTVVSLELSAADHLINVWSMQ